MLGLNDDHCALVLFDVFKEQCTSKVLRILEDSNILYVTVPNNHADHLQPLDKKIAEKISTVVWS